MKRDTYKKENLMITLCSEEKTGKPLGLYISIEPFTEEDLAELLRTVHGLLHSK